MIPEIDLRKYSPKDLPELDWSVWETRRFNRPPSGATVDTQYRRPTACCIVCATWICAGCWDWRRSGALRRGHQSCRNCGSQDGFFVAARHWRAGRHHGVGSQYAQTHPKPMQLPFIALFDRKARAQAHARMMHDFAEKSLREVVRLMGIGREVNQLGCPAGNPCPGTGCKSCCPSYDPCYEKSCKVCKGGDNVGNV